MSESGHADFDRHRCYLSGQWLAQRSMSLSVDDAGFRQGVTAVERLRTYGGSLYELGAHLDRWEMTVAELRIDGLPARNTIAALFGELFRLNAELITAEGDVGVTMFATPGSGGASPTFGIHLNRLDADRVAALQTSGQPLVVTGVVQPPAASWSRAIKVRCRLHYYLADLAARDRDPAALGVLLDLDGTVTETSVANVAIAESSAIVSPPPERVLGGITQGVLERLARDSGIAWRHEPISPPRLLAADEVLLMGTGAGIWFAPRVNDSPIGEGVPGPVYRRLRDQFELHVRRSTAETSRTPFPPTTRHG